MRYTSSLPPSHPVFARELLPGEISRHRPPPPDPPHPEPPLDVTRRPQAFPGEPDASPTSPYSSRRATDDSAAFTEPNTVDLHAEPPLPVIPVDEPPPGKPS